MGFLDFFRKKVEEKNTVPEKLAFSDIENWIEIKTRENNLKEEEALSIIEEKIDNLIKELKDKIIILENFNVSAIKEKDNIKDIVIESRIKYVEFVEELIEKLDALEENKLEEFMNKINKIFFDFNKKSFKTYERATVLIGKEISSIKEDLKFFSKDLLKIFDKNKSILDFFRNLQMIKKKLNEINSINKNLENIRKKKFDLDKKIKGKEKEKKILKQNLDEIKKSIIYLENLSKQEKINVLREELKKDILNLRQLIDFKALISFFHINAEQMKIVKDYKENFIINFNKDDGETIIKLLDEAKLNNNIILEKIEQIKSKISEIKNLEKNFKEDKTQEIFFKTKNVNYEIDNLEKENFKEEKRKDKLEISRKELISLLKKEIGEMNVDLIET